VGARGPFENDYGVLQRDEEWGGRADAFAVWAEDFPLGSTHPEFSTLKLARFVPTRLEAGMMRVEMSWQGGSADEDGIILGQGRTRPRTNGGRAIKSQTVNGSISWRFNVTDEYEPPETPRPGQVDGYVPGSSPSDFTASFYAPTVTYKYGSTNFIAVPKFTDLAAADLINGVEIFSYQTGESINATLKALAPGKRYIVQNKPEWDPVDGYTGERVVYILPGDVETIETRYPPICWNILSETDATPEYVGRSIDAVPVVRRGSGFDCSDQNAAGEIYAVTETWDTELEVNAV
jgi:hypothetical protein